MSNDYFISFLNLCAVGYNDTHFKTEGVVVNFINEDSTFL